MQLDHSLELVAPQDAPYSGARSKLSLLFIARGDPEGEIHTLRSPKNLPHMASNQFSFGQRELNIIRHWSSAPRMPGPTLHRRELTVDALV